jgi:hypothetical protein
MFGFGKKKKQEPQKKQSSLDKILMGMVVGGAIGSVLGVGLAPKKGTDTRKQIGKKAGKLFESAKEIVSETASKVLRDNHSSKPSIHPTTLHRKPPVKRLPEE